MSDADHDATGSLLLAAQSVTEEAMDRIETNLSEKDLVAISSAITKGMIRSFKLGLAFAEDGLRKRLEENNVSMSFSFLISDSGEEAEEVDIWAERYGENE